jgi:hypothetical protein
MGGLNANDEKLKKYDRGLCASFFSQFEILKPDSSSK